jgi:hypothetical protein
MKISFVKPGLPATGTVVVGVLAKGTLTKSAAALDRQTGGAADKREDEVAQIALGHRFRQKTTSASSRAAWRPQAP